MKYFSFVFFNLMLLSNPLYANTQSDAETILDWAEQQYPDTLSPATTTITAAAIGTTWYYRYYELRGLYVGINTENQVYLYTSSDQQLSYYADTSTILEQINTTDGSGTVNFVCSSYLDAFANVSDLVQASCDDDRLNITSAIGLPRVTNVEDNNKIMVGITAWINRVPIPYTYNWSIPTSPQWQGSITEATAKGPVAVAIDGVPIFHYERRPDVSTALSNYTEENDTVVQGELDQCGGHSGQGDDYHYHYTPVCLLDDHDLSKPIAFGLDGVPVYFGEGGTDFYGRGRFNTWNNFPSGTVSTDLDECNALDLGDSTYVHYTSKTPPYVVGCHQAFFDPSLQIEPRPMSGRDQGLPTPIGGEYGEPVSTVVTNFVQNTDGSYQMTFDSLSNSANSSAIIYRNQQDSENCWEFEYREDSQQTGQVISSCRNETNVPPPRVYPIHSHTH